MLHLHSPNSLELDFDRLLYVIGGLQHGVGVCIALLVETLQVSWHLGPDRIARVRAALSAESIKICRWHVGASAGSPWDGPERTGHLPSTRGDCTHILELCQSEIYELLGASTLGYACLLGAHEQSLESISLQEMAESSHAMSHVPHQCWL